MFLQKKVLTCWNLQIYHYNQVAAYLNYHAVVDYSFSAKETWHKVELRNTFFLPSIREALLKVNFDAFM